MILKFLALFALIGLGAATALEGDRTITKVVKLLQNMLDKSKKEGDEERKIYAKFKCYCDTNEADKKANIEKLTEEIALLESDIDRIQGDTGGLSSEVADLDAAMADNKQARDDAEALRKKENKAFKDTEGDLKQAIKQMNGAIKTLADVGADQTNDRTRDRGDNSQFMAAGKASLLSLQTQVQAALRVASSLMNPADQKATASFLQAPFTGTYTSQSGVVMGILKSMRDTFRDNLAEARDTEKAAVKSHKKFMDLKTEEFKEMKESYNSKQKSLGGNDGDLGKKKSQLKDARKQKESDEEFLESLLPTCKDKAEQYEKRKMLRANEEAAIAQAISILNSDDAFATFGGTTAGTFLQLRSIQQHDQSKDVRQVAQKLLQKAAADSKSKRLAKVVTSLQAENPFETVLAEIDKMIDLIAEEGKQDKENLDWCNKERDENEADKKQAKKEILSLKKEIDRLTKLIEDPKKGLKAQIADTEDALVKNDEAQKTSTKDRTEANLAYQADIKNLVDAASILKKAIKVLKTYYDDLAEKLALIQRKEEPTPPDATLNMKGQSDDGNKALDMLKFILESTEKEESEAHSDEESAQHDFEDLMQKLKDEQAKQEKILSDTQKDLAQAEEDLLKAEEDHKATVADKEAIEAYLKKIKPGCDFITKNFDEREKSRGIEKAALEKAIGLIEATPAFKAAENAATVESYGDCKKPCVKNEDHVECLACRADVTIPAYCAGHKGVDGC